MSVIYKKDTGRITVGQAKKLIIDALPEQDKTGLDGFVDYHIRDGEIVLPEEDTLREATASEALDMTFLELCRADGFEPRMKISPGRSGYKLRQADDDHFMVTHPQFLKLAEVYSLTVVIGNTPASPPVIAQAPDPERRLVALRALGGDAKWRRPKGSKTQRWTFTGIGALVKQEKAQGYARSDEKTIRLDLAEAAEEESMAKRSGEHWGR